MELDAMLNKRGGKRLGAGRKPLYGQVGFLDKLLHMEKDAIKALHEGIKAGEYNFVRLFFEYHVGKPKENIDITSNGQSIGTIEVQVLRNIKYDPSGITDAEIVP